MATATQPAFGRLLKDIRGHRRISQLELALRANVSSRHISFLETGRARPSREMVTQLAQTLDVPLRDRNILLTAAGFSERYGQSDLSEPEMAQIRQALDLMLAKQEPWPALVFNARWDMVQMNTGAGYLFGWLFGGAMPADASMSFLELMLQTELFRPVIGNWEEVLAHSIGRIRREVDSGTAHPDIEALLKVAEEREDVRAAIARAEQGEPGAPLFPVIFVKDGVEIAFYSTITTFGTPQDITLQELRIETFFPADERSEQAFESLTRG